ncbi:aldolase [Candidatus Dependentiae bacterium]|nr:aldolase [Candidatus Dependentiae bacterium]
MKHNEIPADVVQSAADEYIKNYRAITRDANRLFLFSGDQKIEHLNEYFYGPEISEEDNDPLHLFKIADAGFVGAFATHLGLISRYGKKFPSINYIAKLNAKTNLISSKEHDPFSEQLFSVNDVLKIKQSTNLPIRGVGYTIYPGSEFEGRMLQSAAQVIMQAHEHGLIAILWVYPRGSAIKNEHDGSLIVGASGLGLSLGADFVKILIPEETDEKSSLDWLKLAVQAAGNTKIILAGGDSINEKKFIEQTYEQIHKAGTAGCAIGRNIHQKPLHNAIAFTKALAAIIYENKPVDQALKMLV